MNAVVIPQMGVLIMDDGREFGDRATASIMRTRPTSVRLALQGAPERPGLRTVGIVPPEKFTLRTAVTAAAAEGLFWIAAPRAAQDPLSAFVDAARGAAGVLDERHTGFAIGFLDPEREVRKIALVADLRDTVTTGIAAWAAVGAATMYATSLDVLVLGAEEDSQPKQWRDAVELFSVRGDGEEVFLDAMERAEEHGIAMRWVPLGASVDRPETILRAVANGGYDLVVDDLPPINVGPRPGRRRRVQAALSQAGSSATAYRLVRDAQCSVVVVLDAARMGLVPQDMARAGAAAIALGVVGAGAVAATSAAASTQTETTAAMTATETSAASAAVAQVEAPPLDYASMTAEDLASLEQQRDQAAAAKSEASSQLQIRQDALAKNAAELEKVAQQEAAVEPTIEEAREAADEASKKATYTQIMASGPLSILPGGPTSEEVAEAKAEAEAAEQRLEDVEAQFEELEAQEAELADQVKWLEHQVSMTEAELAAAEQEAAILSQQASELKWTLNPVVVPTQAGYSISSGFGAGGGYWSSGSHTGLDFAQPQGADVYAAKNGTVVEAGWGGAYGNTIVIQHSDGTQTRYAHLSAINVSLGQSVTAGQHIGDVGSTGNSTGPHLHFEVMDANGNFMDPAVWLGL